MQSDRTSNPNLGSSEEETAGRPFSLLVTSILMAAMFLAGLGVGYLVWGKSTGSAVQPTAVAAAETTPGGSAAPTAAATDPVYDVTRYDVPEDGDPVYGPDSAPITIIEFSDYECAYCIKWFKQVWPQLLQEYGDKIRLVYRDFPLSSFHTNASPAAQAANCAGEQDAYWPYHDLLFSQQLALGTDTYLAYAKQLNLDETQYKECLDSGRAAAEVEADYEYAANLGVTGTPTFFINGMAIVGAQPYDNFKQLIDLELAGKLPKE